jgi:hypothetical protein
MGNYYGTGGKPTTGSRVKKAAKKLISGEGTNPGAMMKQPERSGARYSSPGPKITAKRPLGQNQLDYSGVPKPGPIRSVHGKLTKDPTKTGEAWGLKPSVHEFKTRNDGEPPQGAPLGIRKW